MIELVTQHRDTDKAFAKVGLVPEWMDISLRECKVEKCEWARIKGRVRIQSFPTKDRYPGEQIDATHLWRSAQYPTLSLTTPAKPVYRSLNSSR